ncbi:conserved exported hypothetical protein [Candidatus Terasakiella magnetica]|uniref:Cytochrome c n=1 Tax=Candidatus Terasakiella magnetica TaxID=1867952 RepID=A0A1C3RD02_9PROT|nr:hypothetical protein [Candidatus Terasakiella magnetica]SCA55156.1 conserved exported hypothetical protein [Candidatus Terasakiella magnetica]
MKRLGIVVLSLIFSFQASADEREVITIPSEIKALFLGEMRTHLDNLNEITLAVASGDFKSAAFVAKNKMGFGHSVREIMTVQGKSEEEIEEKLAQLRKKHGTSDHPGRGMGRYMPEEVRELGRAFHKAAEHFANVADTVKNPPTVADYQRVFTALSETIDVCSACHSSYRVE